MDERERIKRIREQQLQTRDPGTSMIPGYDWKKHDARTAQINTKRRKQAQRPLLLALWDDLPHRWRGALIALVPGLIVFGLLMAVLSGPAQVLALLPPLIFGIVGLLVGKSLEQDIP